MSFEFTESSKRPHRRGMHQWHVVGLRDDLTLTTARGFSKHDRDLLEESPLQTAAGGLLVTAAR